MKETTKDLRFEDIAKLRRAGIDGNWVQLWENEFSKEIDNISDENQKLWHLSRISFLAGFKLVHKEKRRTKTAEKE